VLGESLRGLGKAFHSQGTRHKEQGTRHKAQGTRNKEQGTRNKARAAGTQSTRRSRTHIVFVENSKSIMGMPPCSNDFEGDGPMHVQS